MIWHQAARLCCQFKRGQPDGGQHKGGRHREEARPLPWVPLLGGTPVGPSRADRLLALPLLLRGRLPPVTKLAVYFFHILRKTHIPAPSQVPRSRPGCGWRREHGLAVKTSQRNSWKGRGLPRPASHLHHQPGPRPASGLLQEPACTSALTPGKAPLGCPALLRALHAPLTPCILPGPQMRPPPVWWVVPCTGCSQPPPTPLAASQALRAQLRATFWATFLTVTSGRWPQPLSIAVSAGQKAA